MWKAPPKPTAWLAHTFRFSFALCLAPTAFAALQLSSDWQARYLPDGSRVPDDQHEIPRLERAVATASKARTALPSGSFLAYEEALSFKLRIDGSLYYLAPVRFMTKNRPEEQCQPVKDTGAPQYLCAEGQRHTQDCHLLIFNARFEEVGYHRLAINTPQPTFCNAIPGVGMWSKARNEVLITTQYFFIDAGPAQKVSEIGSTWRRMTSLVRFKEKDGRVVVEQDFDCLQNPNEIESIPEARKQLAGCSAPSSGGKTKPAK